MSSYKRRLLAALALLFAVNIALILIAQTAQAATYRQGSSGEQVRVIQDKLKRWGYYDGAVDGIFGSATAKAVRYFQRTNGLTEDGVVGKDTLAALGMFNTGTGTSSGAAAQDATVNLLARVISAEARGEPYVGQVAVGAVILNRVEHPSFPSTVAGVVYQPGAFTCMVDGQ
ncbi:MAG: peptidoglycan-binding protein, partial [Oscillospiraceae bacterium]